MPETVLYFLRSKKGSESLVFWSVVLLAACVPAGLLLRTGITVFATPLFRLGSYILMLRYLYIVLLKDFIAEYEAINRKLYSLGKSIEIKVKKRMREVERVNRKLLDKSKTDPMTGLLNKAALLDAVERLIANKPEKEHSILMFDIDNFKEINDNHGHIAGDKCIKALAAATGSNFRSFDITGRYGGDEFIAVLPDTGARQAFAIAERFRKVVDKTSSPHLTISIGISSYPADGSDARSLIEAADKGLYISKAKGRNAVTYRDVY